MSDIFGTDGGVIISANDSGELCFGDYASKEKKKADNFELNGDLYKVKTSSQMTKLEKNGSLLFEAIPGVKVYGFRVTEKTATFTAEGIGDTQITLELAPECEYKLYIDDVNAGSMHANLSGKVNFSTELSAAAKSVRVEKV